MVRQRLGGGDAAPRSEVRKQRLRGVSQYASVSQFATATSQNNQALGLVTTCSRIFLDV
jgi:hypothetical protein